MCNQMPVFFCHLFSKNQFGFRKRYSAHSAISIDITGKIDIAGKIQSIKGKMFYIYKRKKIFGG